MKLKWNTDEELEQLIEKIAKKSPYRKIESEHKKWMLVSEMGKLLGLKKTDRYWLVHKNFFRTEVVMGRMRIDVESFEKWYANQVKYHKVTGEEPGLELKQRSLSPRDIAELLGISESYVYEILLRDHVPTITVDYLKRVTVEEFLKWYRGQDHFKTIEDQQKEKELREQTLSMPQMARLLGVSRSTIYSILDSERYGRYFDSVMLDGRRHYYKKDFEKFLQEQDDYKLKEESEEKKSADETEAVAEAEANAAPEDISQEEEDDAFTKVRNREKKDETFFTLAEAAEYAGVSRKTIYNWARKGCFPWTKVGRVVRIPSNEFRHWLKHKQKEAE